MIIYNINDYNFIKNMDTVGERLAYVIDSQYSSKMEFCKKNGLEYNSLAPVTTNKRNLGIHLLNKIAEAFPNLNINWLLYGKGSININDVEKTLMIMEEPIENYGNDPTVEVFLKYLKNEKVRKAVVNIINDTLNEKKQ